MIGSENNMSFSKETIGNVFTVVLVRHKFITNDMQRETLEKNQLNGSFQFVNLAMTKNIERIKAERTTRGITNKGFSGLRKVVARFNFSCTLTGNRPQSLIGNTAAVMGKAKTYTTQKLKIWQIHTIFLSVIHGNIQMLMKSYAIY